ncbi:MAG: tryptophan-rich sensory protein [Gemmatimonadetes bacterium]|nr:tryptophan-rich sensory protein [Gemmatimonadota bacterium]
MVALGGWILLSMLAGVSGGVARPDAWYDGIRKPRWNPPHWVFAPAWTVLYVTMGVAAWMVWSRREEAAVGLALGLFVVQLLFNSAWSWIFFRFRRMDLAFSELVVMWLLVLATLLAFWSIRPAAGQLLVPYLLWVTFAGYLNLTLWRLNR